ncbi:MAG: signal peptidase I [Actinomycetes bacterium]
MSKRPVNRKRKTKFRAVALKILAIIFISGIVATPTILHNFYGYGISPVLSGSMRPLAQPGDAFITVDRPASELKVGNIVTLHTADSQSLYAHRIIDIREISGSIRIITKGDANPTAEQDPFLVSPNQKVPVTIARVLWIGHVLVYLTSVQGRQAALALIVVANILTLILAMFKKKIEERNFHLEQVYKDLYMEAHVTKMNEMKKMQLYKELYAESRKELQTIKEN